MGCITSTAIYGDTGDGKTGLVGSWAKWVNQETGKKVRYYTWEPGNIDTIGDLIDKGLIDVVDLHSSAYPAEALEDASNGYSFDLGTNKSSPPGPSPFETYGGFAYEGGTIDGKDLMEELRVKAAKNEIIGAEKAPQQYKSGNLQIAGSNQTHYGIVQGRVRRAIQASQRLPVHLAWTFREVKADDEQMISGYKVIYGPMIVGQAMTPHIPSWFGRTIHCDTLKEGNKLVKRAFFKSHFYENEKTPYIANVRVALGMIDKLPDSAIITTDGLTIPKLFATIKELRQA